MKTTTLMMGAIALVATAAAPAMARQTRAQMAMARKCHAMTHRAMTRDKGCMAMQKRMSRDAMHRDGAMSGDTGIRGDHMGDGRMGDGRMGDDAMSGRNGTMTNGGMTNGGMSNGTMGTKGTTPRR